MVVILTTCEPKDAQMILRSLLTKRLVACGNITSGVKSMYWWDGEIQNDEESTIFMETTDSNKEAALQALAEVHPYDVPKILCWQPQANESYMQWLQAETKQ